MRGERHDKKDGGLMVLLDENMKETQVGSTCPNVMSTNVEIGKDAIFILLVYMDVRDEDRKIKQEIEKIIRSWKIYDKWMILGDFNSHLRFIEPQRLDNGGTRPGSA